VGAVGAGALEKSGFAVVVVANGRRCLGTPGCLCRVATAFESSLWEQKGLKCHLVRLRGFRG
jgi:hypothetical protein